MTSETVPLTTINGGEDSGKDSPDGASDSSLVARRAEEETPPEDSGALTESRARWTLGCLCALSVSAGLFISLLAPFYPTQAKRKGASEVEIGLVFGCFQLVVVLSSPIYGRYMTTLGPKFMLLAGNFVASACAILFGVLEWCPPGRVYVAMCFATRSLEALGAASNFVSIYAIAAHSFPDRVSTAMGLLEGSFCVGLIVGPPLGGALYAAAGFFLPFAVSGGTFMILTFVCGYLLPSPSADAGGEEEAVEAVEAVSTWRLLRRPLVPALGLFIVVANATIGFADVALSLQLKVVKPDITALEVGLVFLLPASLVVVLAPASGVLNDRFPRFGLPAIVTGAMLICIGYLMIGPCPYIPFLPVNALWLVIFSLGIGALGVGTVVLTYRLLVKEAMAIGMRDTMATHGIISGMNTLFEATGMLVGPTLGGVMVDYKGYAYAASLISLFGAAVALVLLTATLVQKVCYGGLDYQIEEKNEKDNEATTLLPHKHTTVN